MFCSSRCVAKLRRSVRGAPQMGSPASSAARWQTRAGTGYRSGPPCFTEGFAKAKKLGRAPYSSLRRISRKLILEEILTGIASPLVAVLRLRSFIPHFAGVIHVAFRICASLPDTPCGIGLHFRVGGTSGGRCL